MNVAYSKLIIFGYIPKLTLNASVNVFIFFRAHLHIIYGTGRRRRGVPFAAASLLLSSHPSSIALIPRHVQCARLVADCVKVSARKEQQTERKTK